MRLNVLFGGGVGFAASGIFGSIGAYLTELFPSDVRANGQGLQLRPGHRRVVSQPGGLSRPNPRPGLGLRRIHHHSLWRRDHRRAHAARNQGPHTGIGRPIPGRPSEAPGKALRRYCPRTGGCAGPRPAWAVDSHSNKAAWAPPRGGNPAVGVSHRPDFVQEIVTSAEPFFTFNSRSDIREMPDTTRRPPERDRSETRWGHRKQRASAKRPSSLSQLAEPAGKADGLR
ncbi:transporter (partial) [Bordetella avium]|nr:transporter (partial) [Bordetella avium]